MDILKNLARVFGVAEMSETEAEAKLNATVSFEELKEKATQEVADAHTKALAEKDTEITSLKADKTRLTDELAKSQERVTELGQKAAAVHSKAATETPESKGSGKSYLKTDVNQRAAAMRADADSK